MAVASLLPVRVDLLLVRGTDNAWRVIFAHPTTGVRYDITGDTIIFTARDGYGPNAALLVEKRVTTHSNAGQGETIIAVTRAEIADAANAERDKTYQYAIRRKLASGGDESVWFQGELRLDATAPPVP